MSNKVLLVGLLLVAVVLRVWVAQLDPFLHEWDERFHALVARNFMDNPFVPLLHKHTFNEYDPNMWCCNHIWLHKQPLFMWLMAGAMKLFGVSTFTLRLPSVLMGSIMVWLLYRIALIATKSKATAFLAALFLAFSGFQLKLIGGIKGMDHNDLALGFFVLASFWAYAEYSRRRAIKWIVLIGLFAACAILTKWLVGLSVFLGWGLLVVSDFVKYKDYRQLVDFAFALLLCAVIFIPWQVYILYKWPSLAAHEFEFNRRHITEVLEGHSGTYSFYINRISAYLGYGMWVFLPIGVFYFIKNKIFNKTLFSISAITLFVFVFFSFFVKTKVESHVFFVVPFLYIVISYGMVNLIEQLGGRYRVLFFALAASLVIFLSLNPIVWYNYIRDDSHYRSNRIYNTNIYKSLAKTLPTDVKIITNINDFEDIDVMFYNNRLAAYHWWVSEATVAQLKKSKTVIAVFNNRDAFIIPAYLADYPYLYHIDASPKTP